MCSSHRRATARALPMPSIVANSHKATRMRGSAGGWPGCPSTALLEPRQVQPLDKPPDQANTVIGRHEILEADRPQGNRIWSLRLLKAGSTSWGSGAINSDRGCRNAEEPASVRSFARRKGSSAVNHLPDFSYAIALTFVVSCVAPAPLGVVSKPEERSHAPQAPRSVAFEPGAPMPCPDPPRDAMPATISERESPLPNARRR